MVSLKALLEEVGYFSNKPLHDLLPGFGCAGTRQLTDSGVPAHTLTTIGQFTLPGAMFVLGSAIAKSPILEAVQKLACAYCQRSALGGYASRLLLRVWLLLG